MTLTQLRYLVAIADAELNITLAASRVHATQPGLSKQLKQLEDELGFLLFVRKGRSLESVTPAGTEVISRARAVLSEANNIRTYAANQRRESQGQLILTTTHTQARFVLPPAVAKIKQAYPQVSVHLQQAAESDALDLLSQGDADIAIISTAGAEVAHALNISMSAPVAEVRRVFCAPDGRPFYGAAAGTGRYVTELCHQLNDLLPHARFKVYGNRTMQMPFSSPRWEARGDASSLWSRMPASATPIVSRTVATGLSTNGRERFTRPPRVLPVIPAP